MIGKSTFINTLLRRTIVPSDQQPCTSVFCEVMSLSALPPPLDTSSEKNGESNTGNSKVGEVVHAIKNLAVYSPTDPKTFDTYPLESLREVVEDERGIYEVCRVYVKDSAEGWKGLRGGGVDVSLIDSPGLNIDNFKTTCLLARQEEIDVVVFVVNAENHFTLSVSRFASPFIFF
jgi:mitofusin 2